MPSALHDIMSRKAIIRLPRLLRLAERYELSPKEEKGFVYIILTLLGK